VLVLALACALALPAGAAGVDELLAKYPARDATTQTQLSEALLDMGPDGITAVAAKLVPSGAAYLAARYALSGLVKVAGRPDARASQRAMVSEALLSAAKIAESPIVAAFLLEQERFVVGTEAVEPLAGFLPSPDLCDPAARDLVTLGTYKAGRAVLDALPDAPPECRLTLIQALGEMHVTAAAPALAEIAQGGEPSECDATLLALADIGAPESESVLRAAIISATGTRQRALIKRGCTMRGARRRRAARRRPSPWRWRSARPRSRCTCAPPRSRCSSTCRGSRRCPTSPSRCKEAIRPCGRRRCAWRSTSAEGSRRSSG